MTDGMKSPSLIEVPELQLQSRQESGKVDNRHKTESYRTPHEDWSESLSMVYILPKSDFSTYIFSKICSDRKEEGEELQPEDRDVQHNIMRQSRPEFKRDLPRLLLSTGKLNR